MGTPKGTKPWNAGTGKGWTDKRGYRWLYVHENGRRVARREHRVIMERHLGRRLEPWELVHHANGDQSDNRLENLVVQSWGEHNTQHHTGTRRDENARRSLEAFALMREELKRCREMNAELLAALEAVAGGYRTFRNVPRDERDWTSYDEDALNAAFAAILKAKGE